jgi:glycosyltransferase involved in cell wall biosynthesis
MRKIKIVFILGTLDIGGTEKQFLEVLRRLSCNRFDLRVLAFPCSGKLREKIEKLRIPLTCLDFQGTKGMLSLLSYTRVWRLIWRMIRYLKQEKPHIVQSYLFWANVHGCIAAKIARVPIIITGRRAIMEEKYKAFPGQWLQNLSNMWATAIIANSHAARQECLQRDKFVTEKKIQVIYNGIDTERYIAKIDRIHKKRTLHIPEDSRVVGIIASLQPRKRHQDFLNAAVRVLQTYPRTVFLIVGRDDGIKSELETLAKDLGIQEVVIFAGERFDIPEILSILDVQVLSSSVEGLSNAILEGMAAGKPIVATQIAGNSELVVYEETGLLVPSEDPNALADAINRLLGDPKLRDRMGRAGKQRVATLFQMERMIQQTEALYQKLVTDVKLS